MTTKKNTVAGKSVTGSGNDIIVTVGNSKITLKDTANLSNVNIIATYLDSIKLTSKANIYNNTVAGATIQALAGNDKITNSGSYVIVDGGTGNDLLTGGDGTDVFIYGGGNDTITDYAAEDKISLGSAQVADFKVDGSDVVFGFDGDDLL